MSNARPRRGLVVLVVLLFGLSVVAPAAAAPSEADATTGDEFGDDLTGTSGTEANESSGNSTNDTSDGSSLSGDSDADDENSTADSDSPDEGGTEDTNGDTGDGNTTSDEETVSDDNSSDGGSLDHSESDDDSANASDADGNETVTAVADLLDGPTSEASGATGSSLSGLVDTVTPGGTDRVTSETDDAVGTVEDGAPTPDGDTDDDLRLVDLSEGGSAVLAVADGATSTDERVSSTITTVSDTVTADDDPFSMGTSGTTDADRDPARFGATGSERTPAASEDGAGGTTDDGNGASDRPDDGAGADGWNVLGAGVPVPDDGGPDDPVGAGAFAGLLGAGVVVVARQSGLISGIGGSLAVSGRSAVRSTPGSPYLDRVVRTLAPLRYSRYDDSDPLEHEAREQMFTVVEESPGTYLSEIAERADIPLSTARHHIRVLEREDLVSGAKVRGKRRFYPAHTEGVELAAAMNDDSTAAVIDALARRGASSVSDLADELDKDPSTVTHHVQRLEEDDVVVRERDGRAVMNRLSAAAQTMLDPGETPAERPAPGEAVASD